MIKNYVDVDWVELLKNNNWIKKNTFDFDNNIYNNIE